MDNIYKYVSGVVAGAVSFFAPVRGLIICALVFVSIDFVTGVAASRKKAKEQGRQWGFESTRAWDTVVKLTFIMAGIALAWLLDTCIFGFINLRLANLFTGFVCGVEFWSYLENAAEISQHPVFRALKKYMKQKVAGGLGIPPDAANAAGGSAACGGSCTGLPSGNTGEKAGTMAGRRDPAADFMLRRKREPENT